MSEFIQDQVSYVPHGFAVFFFLTTVTFIVLWLWVDSPIKKSFIVDPATGAFCYDGGNQQQQPPGGVNVTEPFRQRGGSYWRYC